MLSSEDQLAATAAMRFRIVSRSSGRASPSGRFRLSDGNARRRSRRSSGLRCASGAVALQTLQVGAHFGGALITQVAVFLQRLVDDLDQLERDQRIQIGRRSRIAIQNPGVDHGGSAAVEGNLSRRHLIENGSKGEQIAARIQLFSARLLGRHVRDRADRSSRRSKVHGRCG